MKLFSVFLSTWHGVLWLADSTNTDFFAIPMGVLVESIYGNGVATTTLPGQIQASAPIAPLRMSLLDSLTVHAKMRSVNRWQIYWNNIHEFRTRLSIIVGRGEQLILKIWVGGKSYFDYEKGVSDIFWLWGRGGCSWKLFYIVRVNYWNFLEKNAMGTQAGSLFKFGGERYCTTDVFQFGGEGSDIFQFTMRR